MRQFIKALFVLSCVMGVFTGMGCQSPFGCLSCAQRIQLFNGRDFSGWTLYGEDEGVDLDHVWSVEDRVIYCAGQPRGYMRTKKEYGNYHLHVEWRWPEKPANGGVLVHCTGPNKIWPKCIEAQLNAGKAGDIVLIGNTGITVNGADKQDPTKPYVLIPKQQVISEKPVGQWNTFDIVCAGDTIRYVVNGVLQNQGTKASDTRGAICLTGEGSPIEYRNITLESIN